MANRYQKTGENIWMEVYASIVKKLLDPIISMR